MLLFVPHSITFLRFFSAYFIDFSQEDAASDTATFTDVASGYIAALDDEHLQFFKENVVEIEEIAEQLKSVLDLERLMTKVVYGTASGKDLRAIANTMAKLYGLLRD